MEGGLLARTVKSLVEVNLQETQMTHQQIVAILTTIGSGESQLKNLYIQYNNLSYLEPNIVAGCVNNLEEVNICRTHLDIETIEEICTAICVGATRMKTLNLSSNRLSSVEAGLLAKAVNRLEEVVFFNTGLSQKQAEAILAERRVKTSLRKLNLNRCGLNEDWLTRIRLASGTFLVAEAHGDGEDDEGLEAGGGGGMLLRHSDTHTICFWLGGYI